MLKLAYAGESKTDKRYVVKEEARENKSLFPPFEAKSLASCWSFPIPNFSFIERKDIKDRAP